MTIYIGQHVERVEDLRLLRGRGTFVDDIMRDGMLYAAVLRSPVVHGRIIRIDVAPAQALPDVVAVFTAADFRALPVIPLRLAPIAGVERFLQRAIADAKVRYVGEPIAVVVATSPEIAEDALELIDFEIEPLPAVIDWDGASRGSSLLFEEHGTNVAARYQVGMGDADAAFAKAHYRRKEVFCCHRHTALPMETRGLVADWDKAREKLTIWGMTKVPWFNKRALAAALALSPEQVDLVGTDIGGSFGVRGEIYPEDFLIPHIARALARPVKWIEDRREHLMATNHSREIDCALEIACSRDGTILGLRGEVYANMGAYTRTNGGVVPAKVAQFLPGPYRIPNLAFDTAIFMTNKTPVGTYRAPGRFEANFFRERLMDLAAADLGIDPAAFRHKNLIREEELPYSLGQLVPYEKGTSIDTADCPAGFARVLEEIGYDRLCPLNGTMVDGRLQGVGLACFIESSGGGLKENARMLVQPDGTVTIHPGSAASGQGHETVFAQIAAERLGVALERIRVERASTANLEEGFGTFASRSAVKGGNAVYDGADKLAQALLRLAGEVIGRAANDLAWQDGAAVTADGSVRLDLATLAREAARRGRELDVIGTFSNTQLTYTYGAHAAHVAVDARTGHVEVLDYVALEDVGRALNPLIIHGQLIGAVVQGLGGAFLDHLVYDAEGQLLTGSLADYLVPTASDFPNVRGVTLENKLSPSNPLGVKGGGEGGLVCVAATVANAVAAALAPTGATVTRLPLSPPLLWQSIREAQARSAGRERLNLRPPPNQSFRSQGGVTDMRAPTCIGLTAGLSFALFAGAGVGPRSAAAEDAYPSRAIRLVVPFGAGGIADIHSRITAGELSNRLGQQVVIENRPGGFGIPAAQSVLSGAADGYALKLFANGTATSVSLLKNLTFDPVRDFAPVSNLVTFDFLIVVGTKSDYKTLADVIAAARANPGKLNVGTTAKGSTSNLAAELLKLTTGVDFTVIAYRGASDMVVGLLRGDVDLVLDSYAALKAAMDSDGARPIASTGAKRSVVLPEVPTVIESGIKDFDVTSWNGVFVKAGTPPAVIARLNRELQVVQSEGGLKQRLRELGLEASPSSPEELGARLKSDIDKWATVIGKLGIPKQ